MILAIAIAVILLAGLVAAMARSIGWLPAIECALLSLAASALIILVSTWVMA